MTKIIIAIVIGLIAATLVGVWYFNGVDTSLEGTAQSETTVPTDSLAPVNSADQIKGKNSISSLLGLGKSIDCAFVFSSEGMRGEGTGFFDKGMARIDSLYSGTSTESMASYMIIDSNAKIMYSWFTQDGTTQGIKMSTENSAAQTPASVPSGSKPDTEQITPDSDVQYDCKPWQVDASVFVPPKNVTFMDMTDMSKMMEDMQLEMDL